MNTSLKIALLTFFLSLGVFFATGWSQHTRSHFFVPLAEAFLKGRLYVDVMQPELHEMVPDEEARTGVYTELIDGAVGKYYVIYPPLPAVLLMPLVAVFGSETNQSYFSILLASISVAVSYLVFEHLTKDRRKALALTLLYAFGSMLWYHAIIGSAWYYSQVCGLLFLWAAILATLKKQHMVVIGVILGMAYLSRYPLILTFPFFAVMTKDRWLSVKKKILLQPILYLCLTFALCVGISLAYNWVRYGNVDHYGYTVLERRPYNINNEYSHGSYSLRYAPRVLKAVVWSFPTRVENFPYFVPNFWSMALWIVFPAVGIIIAAPRKDAVVRASWLAIFFLLPVSLFHGGVGSTQFGHRFALDYMPFLLLLIAVAIREKFSWWQKILFVLSIVINAWGVWFIL